MSHDWPRGIIQYGNKQRLFAYKKFLRAEVLLLCCSRQEHTLGNPAGMRLLRHLKPSYWFAAHMHVKFAAIVPHTTNPSAEQTQPPNLPAVSESKEESENGKEETENPKEGSENPKEDVPPSESNVTKFLALSKVIPRSDFLQVIDIEERGPKELTYDMEWLLILLHTEHLFSTSRGVVPMPTAYSNQRYNFSPSAEELAKAEEIATATGIDLKVPKGFVPTVPPYVPADIPNPQTPSFLQFLQTFRPALSDPLPVTNPDEIALEEETTANPDEISLDDL